MRSCPPASIAVLVAPLRIAGGKCQVLDYQAARASIPPGVGVSAQGGRRAQLGEPPRSQCGGHEFEPRAVHQSSRVETRWLPFLLLSSAAIILFKIEYRAGSAAPGLLSQALRYSVGSIVLVV